MLDMDLDNLLAWLNPDGEQADKMYKDIRDRLFKFFTWQGAQFPDECIDKTIDRVARRIAEGVEVTTPNPANFFLGVARNVWREVQRQNRRAARRRLAPPASEDERRAEDRLYACMTQCLGRLSAADRNLMIDYHTGEGRTRSANRARLAKEMGLSLNALRLRCSDIRGKLNDCLNDCLKK